jgi:hypothetical protein
MAAFPALLHMLETLLDVAQVAMEPDERRRMLWIFTAAYFLGYVPLGVGVIIAHVLEQSLGNGE